MRNTRLKAVAFQTTHPATDYAVMAEHTCVLFSVGLIRCAGNGADGRLGTGSSSSVSTSSASAVSNVAFVSFAEGNIAPTVVAVSLGRGSSASTSCAVFSNGKLRCWGLNGSYQLGNGGTASVGANANDMSTLPFVSLPLTEPVLSVASGADFTCALFASSRAVTCWGTSAEGALGVGSATTVVQLASSAKPVAYPATASRPASIHAATAALFTLMEDGTLFATGDKTLVGLSSKSHVFTPRKVQFKTASLAAVKVSTYTNTCVLFADGTAVCFGPNDSTYDCLGVGSSVRNVGGPTNVANTIPVSAAAYINFADRIVDLAVSGSASCFVLSASVRCIGYGQYGELQNGDGSASGAISLGSPPSSTPMAYLALPSGPALPSPNRNIVFGQSVSSTTGSSSERVTCVLRQGDGIYCFGEVSSGLSGTLALGTSATASLPQSEPLAFSSTHLPTDISTGGLETICAVFGTAGVRCWGQNNRGQLGMDGTDTVGIDQNFIVSQLPFIRFAADDTALAVEVAQRTACALLATSSGGRIKCWGAFGFSGATVNLNAGSSPSASITQQDYVSFSDTASAVSITSGTYAFCAQFVGQRWRCWGTDEAGTLLTTRWPYPSLPLGTPSTVFAPYLTFDTTSPATAISVGTQSLCSLHSSGEVKCWGHLADGIGGNQRSALGISLTGTTTPVAGQEYWYYQFGDQTVGAGSAASSCMGYAVSLSADGASVVAGANTQGGNQGAVFTFALGDTSGASIWSEVGSSITPTSAISTARFGSAVALSGDALSLVVAAPGQTPSVAIWTYARTSPTSAWTAKNDNLSPLDAATSAASVGAGVAISPDGFIIALGASTDSSSVGAAWVFQKSADVWTQTGAKLVGSGAEATAPQQGYSVALASNGTVLFSAAPYETVGGVANVGALWVFYKDNQTGFWEESGRIGVGSSASDNCGISIASSSDGSVVAVGCLVGTTGKVVLLTGSLEAGWKVSATFLAATYVSSATATTSLFGTSVALTPDGSTLVIGSPQDDTNAGYPHLGSVIVLTFDTTTLTWDLVSREAPETLLMSTNPGHAGLGQSVAVSGNAGRIVAGAYMDGATSGTIPSNGIGSLFTFQANSPFAAPSLAFSSTHLATQISVGRFHACALFANKLVRCWGKNKDYVAGMASGTLVAGTSSSTQVRNMQFFNFGPDMDNGGAARVQALVQSTCIVMERSQRVKCWGTCGSNCLAAAYGLGLPAEFTVTSIPRASHFAYVQIGTPSSAVSPLIVTYASAPVLAGGVVITLSGGAFFKPVGVAGPRPLVRFAGPAGCVVSPGSPNPAFVDVRGSYLTSSAVTVTTPAWTCAPTSLVSVSTDGGYTFTMSARLLWDAAASPALARPLPVVGGKSWGFRCALVDGRLYCWGLAKDPGATATGYLGREDTLSVGGGCGASCAAMTSMAPIPFSDTTRVVQFDTADYTACAVFASGSLRCWGDNTNNILGVSGTTNVGSTTNSIAKLAPISFQGTTSAVVEVSVSFGSQAMGYANVHACARFASGSLACWGYNFYGQLGQDSTVSTSQSLSASTSYISFSDSAPATAVSAGGFGTCAIFVGGRLRCWGMLDNNLGSTTTTSSIKLVTYMVWPEPTITVVSVVTGMAHRCALFTNGRMRCWEGNVDGVSSCFGQVGNPVGSGDASLYPDAPERAGNFDFISFSPAAGVDPTVPVKQIALAVTATAVLFTNGRVVVFGRNKNGQQRLTAADVSYYPTPPTDTPVSTSRLSGYLPFTLAVTSISAGSQSICAVFVDRTAKCWGCTSTAGQTDVVNSCVYVMGTDSSTSTTPDSVLSADRTVTLVSPRPSLAFTPVSVWPTAVSTAGGQTVHLTGGLGISEALRPRALVRLSGYTKTWTSDPITPTAGHFLSFVTPSWTTGAPETVNVSVSTDSGSSWSLVPGRLLMVQYTNCSTFGGQVSALVGESPAGNVVSVGLSVAGKPLPAAGSATNQSSSSSLASPWVTHTASFALPADATVKPSRTSGSGVVAFPASTLSSPYRNMVLRTDPPLRSARWSLTAGGGPGAPGAARCWVNTGGDRAGYDDGVRDVFVECSGSPTRVNVEVTGVPVSPLDLPTECRMPPVKAHYSAALRRITVTWPHPEQDSTANEYEATVTPASGWSGSPNTQLSLSPPSLLSTTGFSPATTKGYAFGHAVAMDASGMSIVVGAPLAGSKTGAVLVYQKTTTGDFSGTPTVLPTTTTPNANSALGLAVRISADGLVVVAAGPYHVAKGAVWVWTRTSSSSTTWTQLQVITADASANSDAVLGATPIETGSPNDGQLALSSDGSFLAIGAIADSGGRGAIWVYSRTTGTYSLMGGKIAGPDAAGLFACGIAFGVVGSVTTLFATCPHCNSYKGSLLMYRQSGSSWVQLGSSFTPVTAAATLYWGSSIAVSGDGSTIAVGTPGSAISPTQRGLSIVGVLADPDSGQVSLRAQSDLLVGTQAGAPTFTESNGPLQGNTLAINYDGSLVAAGAPFSQDTASVGALGAVYLFRRDSNLLWSQLGGDRLANYAHSYSSTSNYQFGMAVAMPMDGSFLVVGSPCFGAFTASCSITAPATVNTATGTVLVYKIRPSSLAQPESLFLRLRFESASTLTADSSMVGFGLNGVSSISTAGTVTWVPQVADNTPWRGRARPPTSRKGVIVLSANPVASYTLAVSTVAGLQTQTVTAMAWVRTTSGGGGFVTAKPTISNAMAFAPVIESTDVTGAVSGFTIGIDLTGRFMIRTGVCTSWVYGTTRVNDDRWHHVAYAGSLSNGGAYSLYVDGVLEASGTYACAALASATSIKIGWSYSTVTKFDGALSDIRWYKRVLTAQEVLSVFQTSALKTDADLVILLEAKSQGNALLDTSGNSNHAVMSPSSQPLVWFESLSDRYPTADSSMAPGPGRMPWLSTASGGRVRKNAVYFDGSGAYISVPASDLLATNIRTVSFWVLASSSETPSGTPSCSSTFGTSTPDQAGCLRVVMEQNVLNSKALFSLMLDLRTGQLVSLLPGGSGSSRLLFTSGVRVDDNRWHHVAYVFRSPDGHEWWIDGALTRTVDHATSYDNSSPGPLSIGSGNSPLALHSFEGFLADVRIYSSSLSPREVARIASGADDPELGTDPGTPRVVYRGVSNQFAYDPVIASGMASAESNLTAHTISIKANPLKQRSGCPLGLDVLSAPVVVYEAKNAVTASDSPGRWTFINKFEEVGALASSLPIFDWSRAYYTGTASIYTSTTASSTVFPATLSPSLQSINAADMTTTTAIIKPYTRAIYRERALSVALWVRTPAGLSTSYLSVTGNSGGTAARMDLRIKTTHIALTYMQESGSSAQDMECRIAPNLAASTWYHIAAVLNPASNKREIYLNGELKCSGVLVSQSVNTFSSSSKLVYVGPSGGYLDEAYATSNIITVAHVRALYRSATIDSLALCGNGVVDKDESCDDGNFDDSDGCRNDCSVDSTMKAWIKTGSGDDAGPTGSSSVTLNDGAVAGPGLRGEAGTAIVFSTTLGQTPVPYAELPISSGFLYNAIFNGLQAYTIVFWAYLQPGITGVAMMVPFSEWVAGDYVPQEVRFDGCSAGLCSTVGVIPEAPTTALSASNRIYPLGKLDGVGLPAGAALKQGVWAHVAIAHNMLISPELRVYNTYVNGVRVASNAGIGCCCCGGYGWRPIFGMSRPVTGNRWYGSLSDIRVFHRTLSPAQVKDMFYNTLIVAGVDYPRDCSDILELAWRRSGLNTGVARNVREFLRSGMYTVYPYAPADITKSVQVMCDMDNKGGGWTLVMHSKDGYLCNSDLSVPCGNYNPTGQEGGSAHVQYAHKLLALSGEALVSWSIEDNPPAHGLISNARTAMIFSTHLMSEPGPLQTTAATASSCVSTTDPTTRWRPLLWTNKDTTYTTDLGTYFPEEDNWFTGSDFAVCFRTAYGFVRKTTTGDVCDKDNSGGGAAGFRAIYWSQPNTSGLPNCRGLVNTPGSVSAVPKYSQLWVKSMVSVDRQTAETETTQAA